MIRIRRFGIVRTATVLAVLYTVAALIFFGIFALFILLAGAQQPAFPGMMDMGAGVIGLLIGGLIVSAIYGLFGWIFTAIFCLLYNWVASFTGGVEFELKAAPSVTAQPVPPAAAPPANPSADLPSAG